MRSDSLRLFTDSLQTYLFCNISLKFHSCRWIFVAGRFFEFLTKKRNDSAIPFLPFTPIDFNTAKSDTLLLPNPTLFLLLLLIHLCWAHSSHDSGLRPVLQTSSLNRTSLLHGLCIYLLPNPTLNLSPSAPESSLLGSFIT